MVLLLFYFLAGFAFPALFGAGALAIENHQSLFLGSQYGIPLQLKREIELTSSVITSLKERTSKPTCGDHDPTSLEVGEVLKWREPYQIFINLTTK